MLIESGTIYRSLAAQNEFSFQVVAINSTISGVSNIGFSGENGALNLFKFNSGSIFDLNNRYVWSYNPREEINISGNIGSGYINYFINNNPVCLFSSSSGNYYDNFYINTNNSNIDFDLYVEGKIPEYEIVYPTEVEVSQNITGYIKNNSSPVERSFKLLSGSLFNINLEYNFSDFLSGTISGNQSGFFILSPSTGNQITEITPNTLNLIFQSNFGTIEHVLNYNVVPGPIYLTDLITGYTGELGLRENFTLEKFYNFELQSLYPTNRNVHFILENISGHGDEILLGEFSASGVISGSFSKFIYGFDFITGAAFGTGISISETDYYGNLPTGIISNNISTLQFATGAINYNYNLPIFGGSGTGFAPSGTVITGSGYFSGNATPSGYIYGVGRLYSTGDLSITGYYVNNESINIKSGTQYIYVTTGFTGQFINDYNELTWSAYLVSGQSILGSPQNYYGFGDKILGVTGIRGFTITNVADSGISIFDATVLTNIKSTGIYLESLISSDNPALFISSGLSSSSESASLSNNIFFNGDYFYFTGETGWALFNFTGYSSGDKKPVSHISFDLDKSVLYIPSLISIQVSSGNNIWENIYTGILNSSGLYNSNLKYLMFNSSSALNTNNTFNLVRFKFESRSVWLHQFTGNFELQNLIGIKNLQFYHGYNIERVSGDNLLFDLAPNTMTGYSQSSGLSPQNISGEVIYSVDSTTYPAWNAFNSDKINYPYATLIEDVNYQSFIGYKTLEPLKTNVTGFKIEFESTGDIPNFYRVEFSDNNEDYLVSFIKTGDVKLIETGFFQIATGYQYFRLNFVKPGSCVEAPVTGSCYESIIQSNPSCCGYIWDSGCQQLFEECNGLSYPAITDPPLYVPTFFVSGWDTLIYDDTIVTGNIFLIPNIEEYYIASDSDFVSIQNPQNIYFNTGNLDSNTFVITNPSGSKPFSKFLSSATGNKLLTILNSSYSGDYSSLGRSKSKMNFAVQNLNFINTKFNWNFRQQLLGEIPSTDDRVGSSVAMSENAGVIVAGGPLDGLPNAGGSTYLYTGNFEQGWNFKQKIAGYTSVGGYSLQGYSVATNNNGNVVVVGGYWFISMIGGYNTSAGVAVIYTGNATSGWSTTPRYVIQGASGDELGYNVACNYSGNVVVIGAPGDNSGTGSAIILTGNAQNGWLQRQTITGDSIDDRFGTSVAVNNIGNVVVIGGVGDDDGGANAGAAIVYTGNINAGLWTWKQKLTGDGAGDVFGTSVAINDSGNIIVMGGVGDDEGGTNAGAAIIYTGDATAGWTLKQKITGESAGDNFGASIAINHSGNVIAFGAPFDDDGGTNAGAVLIYTGNADIGWNFYQKIIGDNVADAFGSSASISKSGDIIAIGAPFDDTRGTAAGEVRIYASGYNPNIEFSSFGGWSTTSGLKNQIYYDEKLYFIGDTGQYDFTEGSLSLYADNLTVSNNGEYILFYRNNTGTIDPVIAGIDVNSNYVETDFGFISGNTYLGILDSATDYGFFKDIKISDNGFFAGLKSTVANFSIGPNYLLTGRLLNRSPMFNPVLSLNSDSAFTLTGDKAITCIDISKTNGICITVAEQTGRLISSTNSGINWASGVGIDADFPWKKVIISDSGTHQLAVFGSGIINYYPNNNNPIYSGYGIFETDDSGVNWYYITGGSLLIDIANSANGKYVGFIHKNNFSSESVLYISNEYGIAGSFTPVQLIQTGTWGAPLNDIQQVKISNSGIYAVKYNNFIFKKQIL